MKNNTSKNNTNEILFIKYKNKSSPYIIVKIWFTSFLPGGRKPSDYKGSVPRVPSFLEL